VKFDGRLSIRAPRDKVWALTNAFFERIRDEIEKGS
jgi:hypothetical protein